jgi:hypothetical protein
MRVKATNNSIEVLDPALHEFAFGKDENGRVDVTPGQEYTVYGTRHNKYGDFYWVLTDQINTKLPWWMPAKFYEVVDDLVPDDWEKVVWDGYGIETVHANPLYTKYNKAILDGTKDGYRAFEKIKQSMLSRNKLSYDINKTV